MAEKKTQTKAVVKAKTRAPAKPKVEMSETGMLVQMAIDKDLDIDKLERVLDMHRTMKADQSKEDFDRHFSEMQKEFTPIVRAKKGDKGNYAPIDDMVKKYGPIIADHGFSFSWDEIENENKTLTIVLTISGYGHDKKNSKLLPEYIPDVGGTSGKPIMNVLQAEGTRSTYGYRYTMKAGFGITETNEDTDGDYLTFKDAIDYASDITWIKTCKAEDDLKMVWGKVYKKLRDENDKIGLAVLTEVYNNQKKAVVDGTV